MKIVAFIATFYFLSILLLFLEKMATKKTKKNILFYFLFVSNPKVCILFSFH